jgi:hypothetical protein
VTLSQASPFNFAELAATVYPICETVNSKPGMPVQMQRLVT